MLSALIFQTLSFETQNRSKKNILYLLTLLCNVMALLSKINALTFFMVLITHQIFYPFLKKKTMAAPIP
ncbi:hypothetical protein MTBBW1_880005 [Desulfamplus magnetovallimortis]|uniref:Uncharacterized protein n=1 Tax=Desulfamplus magnetovallimortis TaxID=1246637 RepID=A0A1W1HKS3_9BACT|nr:hypothetical protein MTBBW1_880005 [Desulfamplus magnetovallimortis]